MLYTSVQEALWGLCPPTYSCGTFTSLRRRLPSLSPALPGPVLPCHANFAFPSSVLTLHAPRCCNKIPADIVRIPSIRIYRNIRSDLLLPLSRLLHPHRLVRCQIQPMAGFRCVIALSNNANKAAATLIPSQPCKVQYLQGMAHYTML